MIRSLIVDTYDAPLSSTEAALCASMPELVLRGLGAAALEHPHARLCVEGPGADALHPAAVKLGAKLEPSKGEALRLRPSTLVESQRGGRAISIAGAVKGPRVAFVAGDATVASLVEPAVLSWVPLWGGREVDRADTIDSLIETHPQAARLLLILPARHAQVRRARATLPQLVAQVRSACASCGACAPTCPASVDLPAVLRSLTGTKQTRVGAKKLATAASCTGCAACDLVCPSGLSPMRLVGEVGQRLRAAGMRPLPGRSPVLDPKLAQLRAGLGRYARPAPVLS